jgi:two-component system osmolarity sensor histidine kinase EnvZ
MSPRRWRRSLLGLVLAAAGSVAAAGTVLTLQLLMAARLERASLKRLGAETAFTLRLTDLALERYPREAVTAISGVELRPAPPPQPSPVPVPVRLQRQGRQLHQELCAQLDACPRMVVRAAPSAGVWVEIPTSLEPAWLFAPLPRVRIWPPQAPVLSMGLLAAGLVMTTLYLELAVRRPLARLRQSVNALDPDLQPAQVPVEGSGAVRQLTSRFNAMVQRLERSRQERSTMLAGLAHDLRTPITRLQLRLALAERRILAASEAERAQADLDAISRITGQFVAFAAGSGGEPALEVDLADLVGEALAAVETPITLDLPSLVRRVQPTALSRAVANLVENAVAHGRPPLRVELSGGDPGDSAGGEPFVITVADCGAGIPAERWDLALEPFQRLDPARGGSGHCGLGLAIASAVARAHRGGLERRVRQPGAGRPQTFAVSLSGRSHPVTTRSMAVTLQSHAHGTVSES